MKAGLTEEEIAGLEEAEARMATERRRAKEKERREAEEAEARIATAKRKAKKTAKAQQLMETIQEYASARNTGAINWIPAHSSVKEKWKGIWQKKEMFVIEKWTFKYSLKVLNEELVNQKKDKTRPSAKSITENNFEKASHRAENIVKNYLKSLKKKTKDEVSIQKNNSAGR